MARSSNRHPREREVFLEVYEIGKPDEQNCRLEKLCGSDEHLRKRVARLLKIQERKGLFEPDSEVRKVVMRLTDVESPSSPSG